MTEINASLEHLRLNDLTCDDTVQVRIRYDEEALQTYEERYRLGLEMDPIEVVREVAKDVTTLWLFSGFTRYKAARRAGIDVLPALVRPGTYMDARRLAREANLKHLGQPLSREEKQLCYRRAIEDAPTATDDELRIAFRCHWSTIRSERRRLAQAILEEEPDLANTEVTARCGITTDDLQKVVRPAIARDEKVVSAYSTRDRAAKPQQQAALAPANDLGGSATPKGKRRKQDWKPEPMLDAEGTPVPDELRDLFASTALKDLAEEVRGLLPEALMKTLIRRARAYKDIYPHFRVADFITTLERFGEAADAAENGIPHRVCSRCNGAGCDQTKGVAWCRGSGFLPKWLDEENMG